MVLAYTKQQRSNLEEVGGRVLLMSLIQSGIKEQEYKLTKICLLPVVRAVGDVMIQYIHIYIIPPQLSDVEPVKKRKQQLKATTVMVYRDVLGPPCIN